MIVKPAISPAADAWCSAFLGMPVRLVFMLATPAQDPEVQLSLLSQVVSVAANPKARERLLTASSPSEILNALDQNQRTSADR